MTLRQLAKELQDVLEEGVLWIRINHVGKSWSWEIVDFDNEEEERNSIEWDMFGKCISVVVNGYDSFPAYDLKSIECRIKQSMEDFDEKKHNPDAWACRVDDAGEPITDDNYVEPINEPKPKKSNVSKSDAMTIHKELVKRGEFVAARSVMRWMVMSWFSGQLTLGFSDSDWNIGKELESRGYTASIDNRGIASYYLQT